MMSSTGCCTWKTTGLRSRTKGAGSPSRASLLRAASARPAILGVLGLARGGVVGVDEGFLPDVGDRAHQARGVAAPLGREVDVQGGAVADDHRPRWARR
ncbi:MAG: hypothetical protein MZV64_11750 [Ignavibacteriales bacterium]|nr:hypothetical protein [Ignavibacteriales bacterium]